MLIRRKRVRPFLLIALAMAIIAEIVVLSPARLDEPPGRHTIELSDLLEDSEPSLIPGLPKNRVAEYSVEKFQYVSVQKGEKQWKLEADKAFMYNPEKLTHSRHVRAYLFDPEGNATLVTGLESRYYLNKKDLEIYGNVKTVFPDGFVLESEYLRYQPNSRHIIIPTQYLARGTGKETDGQSFQFTSQGLDYMMDEALITLTEAAKVTLIKSKSVPGENGIPNVTTIESDHCLIKRKENLAKFTMNPSRPFNTRFVHITQPGLFARSRRADLHYGNFNQVLQYLIAYEDVLIKESKKRTEQDSLRYATGGRADFDTVHDIVRLTQFPQAYQDGDTVTGDIILMHRDTDVIEIEHSYAYSGGAS